MHRAHQRGGEPADEHGGRLEPQPAPGVANPSETQQAVDLLSDLRSSALTDDGEVGDHADIPEYRG